MELPDLERLIAILTHAAAPAFFLGAVAGFVALMSTRLAEVANRLRLDEASLAEHPDDAGAAEQVDLGRRRARLLNDGIMLSLASGICATLLLTVMFASEFAGFHHAYGGALLFTLASIFFVGGLLRFAQETLQQRAIFLPQRRRGSPLP
jgi:hypothetical protein